MKKLEKARLRTPYQVGDIPLPEYPRPQLRRDSYICLNGKWDFTFSKCDALPSEYDLQILVPFAPESALSGLEITPDADEYMFYRRCVSLPEGFVKDRVILHFGAVDQTCTLFINGTEAMKNEGGYLPFSCDITDFISGDSFEIVLRARDALDPTYPYGKQTKRRGGMWYTPVSGIWQTVWLESLPERAITSLKIDMSCECAKIRVVSSAKAKTLTLKSTGQSFIFEGDEITVCPEDAVLWTPENPHLYYFTVSTDTDTVESYFALREVAVMDVGGEMRLCLNREPYLFNGLLDQGYFPDGLFLPPSYDGYRDDILLAKRLGFNTLRKHIKVEPMMFYYLCDTLGIAVFQDAVNNSDYSFFFDTALPTVGVKKQLKGHKDEKRREVFRKNMTGMMGLLYNTPSVVQYTVFNEGWGQFLPDEGYLLAKKHAGDRPIDATSGWFHGRLSDFDSLHIYFKPLRKKKKDNRPLFISEFGGYSLKLDGHTFGDGVYGYKKFYSKDALADAIASLYLDEAIPLIDKGLSALIMTQLTDVEDEINGFITYDRRAVKIDTDKMSSVNRSLYEKFNRKGIDD